MYWMSKKVPKTCDIFEHVLLYRSYKQYLQKNKT